MVAYASVEQFNNWARGNQTRATGQIEHTLDALKESLLMASSRCIDEYTNQWFYSITRNIYRKGRFGGSSTTLRMPPIISITSLKVNGVVLATTAYDIRSGEGPEDPPSRIVRIDGYGWPSRCEIKAEGKFGWGTVPNNVMVACMMITNKLAQRPNTAMGVKDGLFIARYDPDVNKLLKPFCRLKAA